jgi:long-chain acyl-CoA synthetase
MTSKPNREIRQIRDLKDMLVQSTELYPENEAFYIKSDNGTYKGIKYMEFKREVDSLGTALADLGLKGKYVAVIGENRYEWCLTYLAVACGVGVIVPLDRELPGEEIENLLVRSHASAVIYSGKHEKDMRRISATVPHVDYFINMDAEEDDSDDRFLSLKRLIQKGSDLLDGGDRSYIDAVIDPEAFGILIFTSGTTDLAKGVMLSHKNIVSNIMSVCSVLYIDDTDSTLCMLPLHHTYACTTSFLLILYNGCRISFIEGLKHIAKNIKETSPTIIMAVPLLLESMYKKIWDSIKKQKAVYKVKAALAASKLLMLFGIDARKKLFRQIHETMGGKLRLIISGAAALEPAVSKGFRDFGIPLMQGYGLTECSPIVTVNQLERFRDDSIGLPLPCNEVMVYKPNKEGIGELAVKGSNVMLGYFENSLATEKVLRDGWFHTGDLGKMTREGFFSITGRKKNVIVTKNGKNIYPEEVEDYLNKSPFITESMVYGKDDEASEETFVYAMIVPAMDIIKNKLGKTEVTEDEVFRIIDAEVKNVNKKMPLYKRIRRFTIRQEEFAKTSTKKIKRYMEKIG